jgi:hypothetical protein
MTDLGRYLSAANETSGQPLRLELGLVVSWTAAGDNNVNVLGNPALNVRALSGLSFVGGDTVALLKWRSGYLAIGKVV